MRLAELTGVKKYHEYTKDEMILHLIEAYGLRRVGFGTFGDVLQGDDDRVVYKVFDNDDAYLSFIRFVIKHPNIHYPTIYKIKSMHSFFKRDEIEPNRFYVVKMEKLSPLDNNLGQFLSEFLNQIHTSVGDALEDTPMALPDGRPNYDEIKFSHYLEQMPWLYPLGLALLSIIRNIKGSLDVNSENIMSRSDGTVVIIDPMYSNKSLRHKTMLSMRKTTGTQKIISGPTFGVKE